MIGVLIMTSVQGLGVTFLKHEEFNTGGKELKICVICAFTSASVTNFMSKVFTSLDPCIDYLSGY